MEELLPLLRTLRVGDLDRKARAQLQRLVDTQDARIALDDSDPLTLLHDLCRQAGEDAEGEALRQACERIALGVSLAHSGASRRRESPAPEGGRMGGGGRRTDGGPFKAHKDAGERTADRVETAREKVARREMLTPAESVALLVEGNRQYMEKHGGKAAQADAQESGGVKNLVLACSDARLGGLFRAEDSAEASTRTVYVAGNVAEALKQPDAQEVLGQLAPGATLWVVGHTGCGAVACAKTRETFQDKPAIHALLGHVDERGEAENVRTQIEALMRNPQIRERVERGELRVAGAVVHLQEKRVELVSPQNAGREERRMAMHAQRNFRQANANQELGGAQYAHAVIVYSPKLGPEPRAVFGVEEANHVFSVAASAPVPGSGAQEAFIGSLEMATQGRRTPAPGRGEGGRKATPVLGSLLDDPALASIEYTVEANGTRTIAILGTDPMEMEAVRAEILGRCPGIRERVEAGEAAIVMFRYDEKTGEARPWTG